MEPKAELKPDFYRAWDWLPAAADEAQLYLTRLLTEASIIAHDISARAKSIKSFQNKCEHKNYDDPIKEVTDTVAVRIITYSITDRDRAVELIRERFLTKKTSTGGAEDRNPGTEKGDDRRGYDCHHFVVTGESAAASTDWLVVGGHLAEYFKTFGGLEIQVRTVAAHAWAEFEHSRRYKGAAYDSVSPHNQKTVDQLFGAASDARRALDETFIAIDRVLANPHADDIIDNDQPFDPSYNQDLNSDAYGRASVALTPKELGVYLHERFPDDGIPSPAGLDFASKIVSTFKIRSVLELNEILNSIDSDKVRTLMGSASPVTTVRRLDDELLARYGNEYISATYDLGNVPNRKQQLEWRFDRLRGKVSDAHFKTYQILGPDAPLALVNNKLTAVGAFRELVHIIGNKSARFDEILSDHQGHLKFAISRDKQLLLPSARAREISLDDGSTVWVATNLSRNYSSTLMQELLSAFSELDLMVTSNGEDITSVL